MIAASVEKKAGHGQSGHNVQPGRSHNAVVAGALAAHQTELCSGPGPGDVNQIAEAVGGREVPAWGRLGEVVEWWGLLWEWPQQGRETHCCFHWLGLRSVTAEQQTQ